MKGHKWGIDLGGTKIEAVILDSRNNNKVLFRQRLPTLASEGYDTIISQISKLIDSLCKEAGYRPKSLGIGTPGRLDPATQTLKNSNTVCMNGQPLKADLEAKLGMHINIENDANCFAVSEASYLMQNGMAGAEVIIGVIMGTGVGGGVIVNGQLLSGLHGIGGEWGHIFLDESGGKCYCGRIGCVEKIIAGPALEGHYCKLSGISKPLKEIVSLHQAGQDEAATKTIERLHYFFGKGLAQIINVLDPAAIVIGGGVGNIDSLYTEGVASVKNFIFNNEMKTQILKPKYGDSSGVLGAALL